MWAEKNHIKLWKANYIWSFRNFSLPCPNCVIIYSHYR